MCIGKRYVHRCGHVKTMIERRCPAYDVTTRNCGVPALEAGSLIEQLRKECAACMLDTFEVRARQRLKHFEYAARDAERCLLAWPTPTLLQALEKARKRYRDEVTAMEKERRTLHASLRMIR
ncbi:MAG: hypothetical protein M1826_006209 [Phylliscum demangeonii]|nr:MAG: hypothetical protein M1826_006209 [Phylliscum demangeonii]